MNDDQLVLADAVWAALSLSARVALVILVLATFAFIVWAVGVDHRPVPTPQLRPTASPSIEAPAQLVGAAAVTSSGSLAYADPVFGRWYLALPEPLGTRAVICGPADCVTRTSTDYGPDQRTYPDRIADLSAVDFERVCGVDAVQRVAIGRCPGTVTIVERPHGTLPPTDAGQ